MPTQGVATTPGEVAFDAAPTETTCRCRRQWPGDSGPGPRRTRRRGTDLAQRGGPEQPVIRLEGNVLEGVRIDDSRLTITLAEGFYRECDTKDKLAQRHAAGLPAAPRAPVPAPGQRRLHAVSAFPEANGTVKCTIVQEMHWDGAPHPTATIHGHVVHVPDFGKIYFGEMFITGESRRLTMVRFQLGSEDGGEVTAAEGETNGRTGPPVARCASCWRQSCSCAVAA